MHKTVLARDLMRGPVRQLTARTPMRDAAAFLLRHGISGAVVVDEHGQWIGVFTQKDLARYVQERVRPTLPERSLEFREEVDVSIESLPDAFGDTPVRELMSVGLYTLFPDATLEEVVHAMASFKVHRVFVIEEHGTNLLGVITSMDVLNWMDQQRQPVKRHKLAHR